MFAKFNTELLKNITFKNPLNLTIFASCSENVRDNERNYLYRLIGPYWCHNQWATN